MLPPQSRFRDQRQTSRGKFDRLPHATAEFTTSALDGYGLRCHMPTRPAPYASYPVLVHRLVRLLHASFRPRLATTPLRFAITSPPSGCEKDLHLRAVEHARHNRDRGKSRDSSPPTPPYMRVRIRRFRDLSPRGPEGRSRVPLRFRRSQVPFGLHPIRPWQAQPKLIGWRMTTMSFARYYPQSRFGPSPPAWLLCPLLTSAARSGPIAQPSVPIPGQTADLPR